MISFKTTISHPQALTPPKTSKPKLEKQYKTAKPYFHKTQGGNTQI
jgi:hypothetical protein